MKNYNGECLLCHKRYMEHLEDEYCGEDDRGLFTYYFPKMNKERNIKHGIRKTIECLNIRIKDMENNNNEYNERYNKTIKLLRQIALDEFTGEEKKIYMLKRFLFKELPDVGCLI